MHSENMPVRRRSGGFIDKAAQFLDAHPSTLSPGTSVSGGRRRLERNVDKGFRSRIAPDRSSILNQVADRRDDLRRRLSGPWVKRGSLFVPPTRPEQHGELENIKAFVTLSELTRAEPTMDDFVSRLRDVGLRSLLLSLSRLLTVLHVDGVSRVDLQAQLREMMFTPAMLSRLRSLPNWNERIVFFPQQALFLAKLAILYAPDRDDTRPDQQFRDIIVELLLIAAHFVGRITLPDDPDELERVLVAYQVRNYLLNSTEQIRYMIPRASLLYLKLPIDSEVRGDPDFTDLPAVFRAATGFELKDYLAFGVGVFVWFNEQSYLRNTFSSDRESINPGTFFSKSRIDRDYGGRLLASFTHTYDTARAAIQARPGAPASAPFDFHPFMERPLYAVRDDVVVPLHLGYLEARFTNAIYWTISDYLQDEDRRRFRRFFGRVFELYVRRSLQRAIRDEPGLARRVFSEFTYRTRFGDRKTSDVVLVYPRTAIFLDATAMRIRFEATAVSADVAAFNTDVDHIIVDKAKQLTQRIRDFRAGLYDFGGTTGRDVYQIYPVIVTIQSIPESTVIWGRIRKQLASQGLLTDPGVEPLQLIDVEELEILETILPQGVSLLEILLARAADPERRNIGLKNFLIARYPREGANEFLRREYQAIGEHAKRLFFGDT